VICAYWYTDGYIRTSCKEFSTKNITSSYIHLTNDAVQKHSDDYGKFENANKLSYADFQRYINFKYASSNGNSDQDRMVSFRMDVLPKIRAIVVDTV
jgi:hypothetical protein